METREAVFVIHVVASCTDRKKEGVSTICLRSFRQKVLSDRCSAWWADLRRTPNGVTRVAARDLYRGDHWSSVRSLAEDCEIRTWVMSAGVGLIPESAMLRPYAATFAANRTDSVSRKKNRAELRAQNRQWWQLLSARSGPARGAPRSVAALAASHRRSVICVVGSPEYLSALRDDLLLARAELTDQDRLVLVSSAPNPDCEDLEENWVETDARLQPVVGGALVGLNARVLRRIVVERDRFPLAASSLKSRYRRLVDRQPPLVVYDRAPMTDGQVREFIVRALRSDPALSRTALLQQLRTGGHQCEQRRFKRLFEQVSN